MSLKLPALALLLIAPAASAQRLHHEYVAPEVVRLPVARAGEAIEDGGALPAAIKRDGERLEAPGEADPAAPTFRPPEDPRSKATDSIDRPREVAPDRNTTQDEGLTYHAIFNPTVAPLRRNVAFDRIETDYRMTIQPGPLREAPRGPRTPAPGRELFWGDLKVATGRGPTPVPSVAPDMRILAVETEPPVEVRFSKDGADNYYVESTFLGEVRLKFLVDADQAYFSAPLPGNTLLGALASHPAAQLPPAIAEEGREVLKTLGVGPELPFDQGIDRLVAWFRDFEAAAPEAPKGSIYEDLALGQRGVCRHRAFAFLITARAAGVPVRAVQNEAHAFVEVLAPDGHWRRVDLGGQAPSLDLKGAQDHRLHRPPPDPFAKPEKYLSQYSSQLAGNGEPPDGKGASLDGVPPALGAGQPQAGGGGGAGGAGTGQPTPAEVPLPAETSEISEDFSDGSTPPPVEEARPAVVRLDLGNQVHEAWRGEPLPFAVVGHLATPEGAPIAGQRVQIYVVSSRGGEPRAVGPAVTTRADGRFEASARLPADLPLGPWRLVAASAAAHGFAPARSDADSE